MIVFMCLFRLVCVCDHSNMFCMGVVRCFRLGVFFFTLLIHYLMSNRNTMDGLLNVNSFTVINRKIPILQWKQKSFFALKGFVHPKMKIKSLITHPHAVPTS